MRVFVLCCGYGNEEEEEEEDCLEESVKKGGGEREGTEISKSAADKPPSFEVDFLFLSFTLFCLLLTWHLLVVPSLANLRHGA